MLSVPLTGLSLDANRLNNYLTFVMTSFNQQTEGQYLLVFHIGTAPVSGTTDVKGSI
jgi:hypothetical protein